MVNKETIITGAMIILITYTLSLSLVSQAFPATQTSRTLSSTGSIQIQTSAEIGVYSNFQGTTPLTSLSWGTLEPGGSQNIACYIKNEGDVPLTLSMYDTNWSPSNAEAYLVLSWSYNGTPIASGEVVPITFTLTVSPNIEGITSFSFDINIVGTS